ncbi:MAG: hypothetical protein QOD13_342, partial [Thermoleophilaceae bacterium]|nr:hypothetical protein [Thermoleophilaceae bacterium]
MSGDAEQEVEGPEEALGAAPPGEADGAGQDGVDGDGEDTPNAAVGVLLLIVIVA